MLPPATAAELTAFGHEALSVAQAGLAGSVDAAVYESTVEQRRVVLTENFALLARITDDRPSLRERNSCPSSSSRRPLHPGQAAHGFVSDRDWHATCEPCVRPNLNMRLPRRAPRPRDASGPTVSEEGVSLT